MYSISVMIPTPFLHQAGIIQLGYNKDNKNKRGETMNEEMELTAEEIAKNFGLESNDDFMKALSELMEE